MSKQTTKLPPHAAPIGEDSRTKDTEFRDIYESLLGISTSLQALIPEKLTTSVRRQYQGAGVRRYGLMDKTMDYATEFIQFVPPTFSLQNLKGSMLNIEALRDIQILVEKISRLVNDGLLINGNQAYDETLMYYTSVRDQARRNVPGAKGLYDQLRALFTSKSKGDKITEPEIERDVKALLHGKKDGEIIIKNEKPHLTGGKHEVVDETFKPKGAFKATIQGQICPACGAKNESHAKFCNICGGRI